MQNYFKRYFIGAFLIIMGVFMPWYGTKEYYQVVNGNGTYGANWRIAAKISGTDMYAGWGILLCISIFVVMVLIGFERIGVQKAKAAGYFFNALILGFIFNHVVFRVMRNSSSFALSYGALPIFLGSVLVLLTLRKEPAAE